MDEYKKKRNYDPSLESTTPDVEYVNGVPTYRGRTLTHPLSYGNAKVREENEQDEEDRKRDKYRMLNRFLTGGAK